MAEVQEWLAAPLGGSRVDVERGSKSTEPRVSEMAGGLHTITSSAPGAGRALPPGLGTGDSTVPLGRLRRAVSTRMPLIPCLAPRENLETNRSFLPGS